MAAPPDARRQVHVATEEVARLFDGLARMQADANADGLVCLRVAFGEGMLHADGAAQPVQRGAEGQHEDVAHRFHLVTAVGGELLADDGVVFAQQLHPLGVAQLGGPGGAVLDVGEEQSDGAVGGGLGVRSGRSVSMEASTASMEVVGSMSASPCSSMRRATAWSK